MAAESVKVIVRCRPMNGREENLKCKQVVSMDGVRAQCSIVHPSDSKNLKSFTFDGAFFTDSTTEQIYADIGYPLVEGVTEGYNGTIFAYGQTGCGKSFSMQGITDPPTQRGIIPRAFDHIFETITSTEGMKFLVHASYLEIYNEEIRDLLGKEVKHKLDLKEHPDRGVYVQGLSMHPCKNVSDCYTIMDRGWKNRSTGSTLMNADSSRSHSIFTIHLEMCEPDETGEEHIRAGKLNLVDLAGSERQAKTGATGDRLKEATKINLSLSALGNVISALVDGKSKHIPYRDSKLTRLLQDSLGGNTKTLMVACLSPADNNYDETLSTLRYANRAKNIKNKPKINEDPKDALLREYQDEITRLKAMLRGEIPIEIDANFKHRDGGMTHGGPAKQKVVEKVVEKVDTDTMDHEKTRIREEYEQQMQHMKQEFNAMKISKEKMEEEMSKMKDHYMSEMASIDSKIQSPGQGESALTNGHAPSKAKKQKKKVPDKNQANVEATNGHVENGDVEEAAVDSDYQLVRESTFIVDDDMEPESVCGSATPVSGAAQPTSKGGEEDMVYGEDGEQAETEPGAVAPSSSPIGNNSSKEQEARKRRETLSNEAEAFQRLQELQEAMVGGEEANNTEVKERRKKKKRHAEERKRRLEEALANMDGEDIMLNIYDNVQDELKVKNKLLEKEKKKVNGLELDIKDLQAEFEFDRIDYLDTIRKQERQIKLLQGIIDKIHPCIRRDCNYTNLDRIKVLCEWDEDKQAWTLPQLTIEKTKLPSTGVMPGGRELNPRGRPPAALMNGEMVDPSEDRYLQKLHNSTEQDIANNYFRNKRADKLLIKSQDDKALRNRSPKDYTQLNGNLNGTLATPWTQDSQAAAVHGQFNQEDVLSRKPMRLDALPPPSGKGRKKKKAYNVMEQY